MARPVPHGKVSMIGHGPRSGALLIPAASVVAGSFCSLVPFVSELGWVPDFGFLMLLGWRLLRADAWPAWWAAPLGLANDLVTGAPVGQSIALWAAVMLLLDLADRRTLWRDYWVEWLIAAVLIVAGQWFAWRVAALGGARVPFAAMVPPTIVSIFAFPLAGGIVALLDRWRLGR